MESAFNTTICNQIAKITLDSPPANTWTLQSLSDFKNEILRLSENKKITALILESANKKFFSAGADLKTLDGISDHDAYKIADIFGQTFEALTDFDGITIASIEGYAMGGGLEVALACDLRIVSEQAKLGLPEAKVGLLPCAGGTQNLTALVGEGWAKKIILCGEIIDGNLACKIGLAEEISPNPLEKAKTLADSTKNISPDSLSACKKLIQMGRSHSLRSNLINERTLFVELFTKPNRQEGIKAFIEKRTPNWIYE